MEHSDEKFASLEMVNEIEAHLYRYDKRLEKLEKVTGFLMDVIVLAAICTIAYAMFPALRVYLVGHGEPTTGEEVVNRDT